MNKLVLYTFVFICSIFSAFDLSAQIRYTYDMGKGTNISFEQMSPNEMYQSYHIYWNCPKTNEGKDKYVVKVYDNGPLKSIVDVIFTIYDKNHKEVESIACDGWLEGDFNIMIFREMSEGGVILDTQFKYLDEALRGGKYKGCTIEVTIPVIELSKNNDDESYMMIGKIICE